MRGSRPRRHVSRGTGTGAGSELTRGESRGRRVVSLPVQIVTESHEDMNKFTPHSCIHTHLKVSEHGRKTKKRQARRGETKSNCCKGTNALPSRLTDTLMSPATSSTQVFKCPFCSHDASCEVKLDRSVDTGSISCRVCGESYQSRINHLTEPVDVFCEWVDACDAARKDTSAPAADPDVGAPL